jgi:SAM-dependent methyltransferase
LTIKRNVAEGLGTLHLRRPAFALLERAQALRALPEIVDRRPQIGPDGVPLPPPLLRVKVAGTADRGEFLAQSFEAAKTIREALAACGDPIEEVKSLLDFGCGCGRVLRQWASLPATDVHGTDYNPNLIAWCRGNLRFATFSVNGLAPPLVYEDERFDLAFAISVFTHLTPDLEHRWIAELHRVLRPGGRLLLSTRGTAWVDHLTSEEREAYRAGDRVDRYAEAVGSNLMGVFHPVDYVRDRMAPGFVLTRTEPVAFAGQQDLHILTKRSG